MFNRKLALGLTAAAAIVTLGATSAPAFAGGTPNPHPTPTQTKTYPPKPPRECPPGTVREGDRCVPVRVRLQQQEFDLLQNNLLPDGWVLGTGPIDIAGGIDKSTSNPRVDFFDTADSANGVRINHEALSGAVIDRQTCSITFSQADLPWSIHQGFGRFLGATGNGVYDLEGLFSFPTRYNHCTLPRDLSSGQADWDINHGGVGLPQPLAFSISVQAVGRSAVVRHRPEPCPTRSVFAPVNGSQTGQPDGSPTCDPVVVG
jgi:hypothetical protein